MKKIIIAPDSFKETMTNVEVASIIESTLKEKYPCYRFKSMPIADGGEGSLDAITMCMGETYYISSLDANMNECTIKYVIFKNSLIIEVAQNVGFKYKMSYSTPGNTSTFGIGKSIKDILENNSGLKNVYICLGGTITNDGGCGIASALGVSFYNNKNEKFIPVGDTLINIKNIDMSDFINKYNDISFVGLSDVTNPLYGENGASFVFAKQKGATDEEVILLDKGLRHLDEIAKRDLNKDNALCKGSGAAGGIGYGILTFLNAKIKKGIDTILSMIDFDDEINDAYCIITGEGKLDKQSFCGKVISGIIERAKVNNIKVVAVVGMLDVDLDFVKDQGISEIYVSNTMNYPFEKVKRECKNQLISICKTIEI